MKTPIDQKTNLEVFTVSNQKPMEVVTHGRGDTSPLPLLDNQMRRGVQFLDKPKHADAVDLLCVCSFVKVKLTLTAV